MNIHLLDNRPSSPPTFIAQEPTIDSQLNGHAEYEDDRAVQAIRMKPASPRINPFHLVSHPNSDSALPPLPPHLERLASGEDGTESVDVPMPNGEPPLHIKKVKKNFVQTAPGPGPDSHYPIKVTKKGSGVFQSEHSNEHGEPMTPSPVVMQGPPPSPPISEVDLVAESDESHVPSEAIPDTASTASGPPLSPLSEHTETTTNPGTPSFSPALTTEPADMSPVRTTHLGVPSARRVSSSSTASRTGSLAVVRASRLARERTPEPEEPIPVEDARRGSIVSLSAPPKMARRSTNPTPIPARSPLLQSQSTFAIPPSAQARTAVPGLEGSALDSDILAHTEIIRRERLERRQKKATAEDEPVEQGLPQPKPPVQETKVLVGNLIGEDHVNYVLMYNMLTGIRIGVSRCQAKIKRPLTDEDYLARHKFSFDIIGNELTPSAKYDFKFKDYAPWVFRDLRDEHFHLDPADYLLSLTAKYILSELGSPGKSGSFFYFSRDYRFIIKTISHSEHKFLRSILKDYHEHVKTNPHTLVSRFYGLHRVKLPRGKKIHFVIMNNLFPPHRDIHETYDLKGSAFGREYDEEKAKKNPKAVLKDKNWVKRGRTLELGPEKRALFSEQLRRDMEFLKRVKVMDYSLLVGIHNMERGNRDNLRENQLSIFHPDMLQSRRKPSTVKHSSEASNVRKAVRRSDPKMLDAASQLPNADSADRRHFLFYQDEGGLRATDEANQNMDVIYYLGVIDICTPYNTVKKIEHFWKSMTEDRSTISCTDPVTYGQRFLNFLMSVMRGGDPSLRPAGLEVSNAEPKPVEPIAETTENGAEAPNAGPQRPKTE